MFKYIDQNKIDLLRQFVRSSFKMRYQNSVLGFLWVLIKPYTMFAVMYVVISNFKSSQVENFGLYLLSGLIFYTFIQEMIVFGQMALLDRANVILKVNFSRQIAVIASLIGALINLVINVFLVLFIILIVNLSNDGSNIIVTVPGIIYLILVVVIAFIWCLGLSLFFSILTVRLRDLKNVFELGFSILYWATPIFYSVDENVGGSTISQLIKLNPFGIIINEFRASLGIYGTISFVESFIFLIIGIIILMLGWQYFTHKVKIIAEYF